MATSSATKLYTSEVLSLAVDLTQFPLKAKHHFGSKSRSSTCGSLVEVGLDIAPAETISGVGLSVSACAIGQAASVLMARDAIGHDLQWLESRYRDIEEWLANTQQTPSIESFDLIARAKDYPARHGAILLPWRAAIAALSNPSPAG